MGKVFAQTYFSEQGWTANPDGLMPWLLLSRSKENVVTLTDKQQQEQRECPDIATGNFLMHLTRNNRLKELREYGLYEHVRQTFSDAEIGQIIELAAKSAGILGKSWVVPEPLKLAGVNMPDISPGP